MNAENALLGAYRKWRRLAEAEGKAIWRRDWKFFTDCEQAIQSLQPVIFGLTTQVRADWKRQGVDSSEKEHAIGVLRTELTEMGRRNHATLQSLLASAHDRLEQLRRAGHNLKRLKHSYARPAAS